MLCQALRRVHISKKVSGRAIRAMCHFLREFLLITTTLTIVVSQVRWENRAGKRSEISKKAKRWSNFFCFLQRFPWRFEVYLCSQSFSRFRNALCAYAHFEPISKPSFEWVNNRFESNDICDSTNLSSDNGTRKEIDTSRNCTWVPQKEVINLASTWNTLCRKSMKSSTCF